MLHLSPFVVRDVVKLALEEDLGRAGDITTDNIIPSTSKTTAAIVVRKPGVVAGLPFLEMAFKMLDNDIEINILKEDSSPVKAGDKIAEITGSSRAILSGERVALNFLGHLSGIATTTRKIADLIEDDDVKIACTRKTTPGLRSAEKYAVSMGGGANHRFGLDDGVMIKDNHIAVVGSITKAVEQIRSKIGHMVMIEVEVDTLEQFEECLAIECIDAVLLDNMSPDLLRQAVEMRNLYLEENKGKKVTLEASGGITISTIKEIASTGVDIVSIGWLTHSSPSLDYGLDYS
ncbi:MAG: carboxylating nicotinate-nucleotide diphosphorylase [Alphaproteobacteria bacterium]|nr:carboxylating nicotinate-nucleotide diphosphorylase [Alphaproteobacteria bacterium]